jgi:hypothetical protein
MPARYLLLLCIACAGLAQSDPAGELRRIRRHMAQNLNQLPNFTCLETIERFRRASASARWELSDRVRLEVAQVGQRELFSWPGAGQFDDTDIGDIVGGGMTGTGDFALFARSLFLNRDHAIIFAGSETLDGRRALRYDYRIARKDGRFRVGVGGKHAMVGYSGSFWADAETLDLLRLAGSADDTPAELGLSAVTTEIQYTRVLLGERAFLLPQTGESVMTFTSGQASRNRIVFQQCRQYTVDVIVSFAEDAAARPSSGGAGVTAFELPPGIVFHTRLETPIDSQTSAVGDPLRATVARDIKSRDQILVPAGAVLAGRIRRLERYPSPTPYFAVALEFYAVESDGRRARLFAELDDIDPLHGLFWRSTHFSESRRRSIAERAILAHSPKWSGVGTFFYWGSRLRLPAGLRLSWRTAPRPIP